jgi:hypothetical protein
VCITILHVTHLDSEARLVSREWMEESLTGSASSLACPRQNWPGSTEYRVKVSSGAFGTDRRDLDRMGVLEESSELEKGMTRIPKGRGREFVAPKKRILIFY